MVRQFLFIFSTVSSIEISFFKFIIFIDTVFFYCLRIQIVSEANESYHHGVVDVSVDVIKVIGDCRISVVDGHSKSVVG